MEYIAYFLKFAVVDPWRTRGAIFCLTILLLFSILPAGVKSRVLRWCDLPFIKVLPVLMGCYAVMAATYLFFPNYLDHVESSIAALGAVLERGDSLYPVGDLYPYNGIIYGPALAEIQWIVRGIGLPVVLGSKLPGIMSFLAAVSILLHLNRDPLARGYLVFMLPLGVMLFWDRSEPFFLMLVSVALLIGRHNPGSDGPVVGGFLVPLVLGLLGGAASAFKLHGITYIFAVYLATFLTAQPSLASIFLFASGAAVAFVLPYMAPGVSMSAFFEYVRIIGKHGISIWALLGNMFFLAMLAVPVVVLCRGMKMTRQQLRTLGCVAGAEIVVALVAAKPGTGVYHLMPFIPINAYIMGKLAEAQDTGDAGIVKVLYASALVPVTVGMLMTVSPMLANWKRYGGAQVELLELSRRYAGLVAGVSSRDAYPFAYLRVLLKGPQPDYAGLMDLKYSGVGDDEMVMRLRECRIEEMAIPKVGAPFSLPNFYTGQPLMSDDLRSVFETNYKLSSKGMFYDVYSCSPRAVTK